MKINLLDTNVRERNPFTTLDFIRINSTGARGHVDLGPALSIKSDTCLHHTRPR